MTCDLVFLMLTALCSALV